MKKIIYIAIVLISFGTLNILQAQNITKNNLNTINNGIKNYKTKPVGIMNLPIHINNQDSLSKLSEASILAPGDKAVFFVHGLGGNGGSWDTPQGWTSDNYKAVSPNIEYTNASKISNAESDLRSIFENFNQTQIDQDPNFRRSESIYIAHSMGGVVALQMNYEERDNRKQQEFGALATFGSPLAGAPVVDNSECFEDLLNEACKVFANLKVREAINNIVQTQTGKVAMPIFLKSILNTKLQNAIINLVGESVEKICDKAVPFGFDFLKESIQPAIGKEISPKNSDVIKILKKHEVNIPSLAFWGTEEAPISLREIYSLNHNTNVPSQDEDNPNPPSSDYFTADYDDGYIDQMDDLEADFDGKSRLYKLNHDCEASFIIFTFADHVSCWLRGGRNINNHCVFCKKTPDLKLSKLFSDAAQWIRDFDNEYLICFGLAEYKTVTKKKTVCKCVKSFHGGDEIPVTVHNGPCDGSESKGTRLRLLCETVTTTSKETKFVKQASDGVVSNTTSKKINVAPGVYFKNREFPRSNHQQMRNDKNAGKAFKDMYGGFFNNKFKLEKRN